MSAPRPPAAGADGSTIAALAAVRAALDEHVPPLLIQARAPWATVAVRFRAQSLTWVWNAPAAGTAPNQLVTPDTIVRWASLAKPFTALLILRLAALGRLDLADPAVRRSPSFRPRRRQMAGHPPRSITIRHLLTHTSGMGVARPPVLAWDQGRPPTTESLGATSGPFAWALHHAPGAAITYSSMAYTWLQSIIEDVAGETFEQAARTLLLDPLGLDAVALLGDGPSPGPIAWGNGEHGEPITPRRSAAPGASGLFGSPESITRLFGGLIETSGRLHELLGAEHIAAAISNQTPHLSEAWGLGWRLQDSADGPVIRHAGWPDGVLAYTEGLPRLRLLTSMEIGRADAKRALVRIADIARWHAREAARPEID